MTTPISVKSPLLIIEELRELKQKEQEALRKCNQNAYEIEKLQKKLKRETEFIQNIVEFRRQNQEFFQREVVDIQQSIQKKITEFATHDTADLNWLQEVLPTPHPPFLAKL